MSQPLLSTHAISSGGCWYRPLRDGGGEVRGLDGTRLQHSPGSGVHVAIEPRKRRRRGGGGGSRGERPAAAEPEPGYDRWGRWPVTQVFEVRRVRGVGRRRWLEARVRWRGVDPATQLPYPDMWIPLRDEHGSVANAALNREARELERQKYGNPSAEADGRRAEAAVQHAADAGGSRWAGRLRRGASVETEPVVLPPRRRRWRHVIQDGSSDGESAAPTSAAALAREACSRVQGRISRAGGGCRHGGCSRLR